MFLVIEVLFIILLVVILFMVYKNDGYSRRNGRPHGKAEEYWDGKERRKHTRFRKALDISYSVKKSSKRNNHGKTSDISEGGIKFLHDEKLQKGTLVDLKIPLSSHSQPVEVEGEVMWSEEAPQKDISGKRLFYSGIMLKASPDQSYSFLIRYVRSLQSDDSN